MAPPNPRLQRTRSALLRSPLSRKPLGALKLWRVALTVLVLMAGTLTSQAAPAVRLEISQCPRCNFVPPLCSQPCASDAIAGERFPLTIVARDSTGQVDPTYRGTVAVDITPRAAVLPLPHTFTSTDAGVGVVYPVILGSVGTYTVAASDTIAFPPIEGSVQITVVAPQAIGIPMLSTFSYLLMTVALAAVAVWLMWQRGQA